MKLSKKTRAASNEVIQVDDYRLVAALSCLGFEKPCRQYAYVSEEIAEDFYDDVIEGSVYIYANTRELRKAIKHIKDHGFTIDRLVWNQLMDEMKVQYGVGPSKLENYSAEYVDGRLKITSRD